MYGKSAMTCFKYQVYLSGLETFTHLNTYCTLSGYAATEGGGLPVVGVGGA
jgi:hypothetical protein